MRRPAGSLSLPLSLSLCLSLSLTRYLSLSLSLCLSLSLSASLSLTRYLSLSLSKLLCSLALPHLLARSLTYSLTRSLARRPPPPHSLTQSLATSLVTRIDAPTLHHPSTSHPAVPRTSRFSGAGARRPVECSQLACVRDPAAAAGVDEVWPLHALPRKSKIADRFRFDCMLHGSLVSRRCR